MIWCQAWSTSKLCLNATRKKTDYDSSHGEHLVTSEAPGSGSHSFSCHTRLGVCERQSVSLSPPEALVDFTLSKRFGQKGHITATSSFSALNFLLYFRMSGRLFFFRDFASKGKKIKQDISSENFLGTVAGLLRVCDHRLRFYEEIFWGLENDGHHLSR